MREFKVGDKVLVAGEIRNVGSGNYYVDFRDVSVWESSGNIYPFHNCKTYEDGMAEAWEMAWKICTPEKDGGIPWDDIVKIFSINKFYDAFKNFTVTEAAAKIKAWEDKQRIHVGDILRDANMKEVIVLKVSERGIYAVWPDGSCGEFEAENFTKTGRTIDIAGLLAEIGGAK